MPTFDKLVCTNKRIILNTVKLYTHILGSTQEVIVTVSVGKSPSTYKKLTGADFAARLYVTAAEYALFVAYEVPPNPELPEHQHTIWYSDSNPPVAKVYQVDKYELEASPIYPAKEESRGDGASPPPPP